MMPAIAYPSKTEGPASLMVCEIPRNNPVPIAPPSAISCICRLETFLQCILICVHSFISIEGVISFTPFIIV